MSLDPRHWTTADGRRYVSIAAPPPIVWKRTYNDQGRIVYLSAAYSIVRRVRHTACWYTVHRDGVELPLAVYTRLSDAKDRALKNAEGRDEVNVA